MRVAVLGAGVTGLVAARRLALEGHRVAVYERWPGLGGQAATVDVGGGHRLERYYHHWFTSDRHIVALCDELGVADQIEWRPSSMAFFADGGLHPFTTPLDLLRFSPVPLLTRLRMGLAVVALQRRHPDDVTPFEGETARAWIERRMGAHAYAQVWGPLLRGKFGDRADDISMSWLWAKFTTRRTIKGDAARRELLGYPGESFEPLFGALRDDIEGHGGRVLIDRPAAAVGREGRDLTVTPGAPASFRRGHDPRRFELAATAEPYDAVLATVPSDVFERLLDPRLAADVGEAYLERTRSIEYHTALCLLLELDRRFSPYYWTNIADAELPFVGLIEHTNLIDPRRYDGRRFLYVANYLAAGDPLLELDEQALLARYLPGLRKVNPEFSERWVRRRWLFREPAAQPIVDIGYRARIPALQTPVDGLVLANTTQVYPEDRGTNYAVRLGEQAARSLVEAPQSPAAAETADAR